MDMASKLFTFTFTFTRVLVYACRDGMHSFSAHAFASTPVCDLMLCTEGTECLQHSLPNYQKRCVIAMVSPQSTSMQRFALHAPVVEHSTTESLFRALAQWPPSKLHPGMLLKTLMVATFEWLHL